jgi:hypothetical protein
MVFLGLSGCVRIQLFRRAKLTTLTQYASGATVQILLFATLAIELKRRAPNAHTFLEVIRARYGKLLRTTRDGKICN